MTSSRQWLGRTAMVAAVFAGGFVCGSLTQRDARAQLGELGGKVVEKAGESGGPLGAAVKLGTAITDMQEDVNSLQKNLETLRQIKSALGG